MSQGGLPASAAPELRVYLQLLDLQPQFAAYLGTPTRARGYPPYAGQHALIVEVAPGLAIERVTDLALRQVPEAELGILFVERQFGVLEVHADALDQVEAAGAAILAGLGARAEDQLRPQVLFHDIIHDITDQHAVILNRVRQASMVLPGQSLLVFEMTPALFAAVAANIGMARRHLPRETQAEQCGLVVGKADIGRPRRLEPVAPAAGRRGAKRWRCC